MLKEAFFETLQEATPRNEVYLVLWRKSPYYGGPEEGGWWGTDFTVEGVAKYPTQEAAEAARAAVEAKVKEWNDDAKRRESEACLRECEWLDARGLDADFLPERDGEESYFVCIEEEYPRDSYGPRHYE